MKVFMRKPGGRVWIRRRWLFRITKNSETVPGAARTVRGAVGGKNLVGSPRKMGT